MLAGAVALLGSIIKLTDYAQDTRFTINLCCDTVTMMLSMIMFLCILLSWCFIMVFYNVLIPLGIYRVRCIQVLLPCMVGLITCIIFTGTFQHVVLTESIPKYVNAKYTKVSFHKGNKIQDLTDQIRSDQI